MYSLENAKKFKWSSVSGDLNPERISYLEKYIVGSRILDAGCGGGGYVDFLCRQGFHVTGVDINSNFLDLASNHLRQGNYVYGDLNKLPFPDKYFDSTYCFDVLEHLDDLSVLKELIRVTQKIIIITVPREDDFMHNYNLTFLHYQDKTHLRNYTKESLLGLLKQCRVCDAEIIYELFVPIKCLISDAITLSSPGRKGRLTTKIINLFIRNLLALIPLVKVPTGLVAIIKL
jgi:SAM-dependent methyltransferase